MHMTLLQLLLAIIQAAGLLFLGDSTSWNKSSYGFFDVLVYLVPLYGYASMTLREQILRLNGSHIRTWWLAHHYLCILTAAAMMVWQQMEGGGNQVDEASTFAFIRPRLILFMIYVATIQTIQYRHQRNRLYTLRALAKVSPMETTTDLPHPHVERRHLGPLMPFIFSIYVCT